MTKNSIRFKQFTALVMSCAALVAVAAPRHIRPPTAHSYGHTLEEWAAFWCQSKAPFLRPDPAAEIQCSFGQSGPVEFLADGTPSSNLDAFHTTLRECVVPEGQALFFPIHYTFVFSTPDFPVTEDELRARSSLYLSYNTNRQCEIDGRPIEDLERYRRQTPAFSFPWNGGGD